MAQPRIRRLLRHGTLPQLRAFEAVARLGSFTRAAAELHLAQATVSGHVRKLAEAAGAPLFAPAGKRVTLTAAGRALGAAAGEVFASLERAEFDLAALRGGCAGGRLALAAEDDALFVARLVARLAGAHPGLEIAVRLGNRLELGRRFAARDDDLYLLLDPPSQASISEPLRPNPLQPCARRDHELAGRAALPFACCAAQTLLVREPGAATRTTVDRLLREHRLAPGRLIEFSSDQAIAQAAATGDGIALLSADALAAACDTALAPLDVEGFPLPQRWFGVLPVGLAPNMAAHDFLALLRADARAACGALADAPPALLAA